VLALLGNVAIWSVISLFDLRDVLTEKAYGDWMIIALSLLAPFFALTKLPSRETFESGHFNENTFFSFLVKYIAIPFIFVYFIILYAYSVKVLMNFSQWPKGEVSWMVIGFSLFGYLIYIFSYIFEPENRFIRFFRKGFPAVVLPQLAMLGYAIYLRINQYDLTMNRYFVVVFGIWLLVISLYLLISSKKYLAFIPAILTVFTILVSIGPWSVYHLPMDRQMKRLETNLVRANILQGNTIVPLKTAGDISRELSKEIYEEIDYVCGFDDCVRIKERFAEQYKKIEADSRAEFETNRELEIKNATTEESKKYARERVYTGPYKWEIVRKITEMLKVETYYGDKFEETPMITFSQMTDVRLFPLDIRGYVKIYQIDSYYKAGTTSIPQIVSYNQDKQALEIIENKKVIDTISLHDYFKHLSDAYSTSRESQLPLKDMTFTSGKYRIIFESMTIKNPKFTGDKTMQYSEYMNGFVLVK
jgi:flagellar biosynthesis protein FliQ